MAEDTNQGTNLERNSAGGLNDPHSRRLFLRAAVIGTAGVAGAAGVAGVALAHSGKSPSILGTVLQTNSTPSKPPTGTLGFEETGQPAGSCITKYGKNGNGKIENYLIFLGSNLPAGSYSFTATEQLNAGPAPTLTQSSLPWRLTGPSQIHVDEPIAAGTGTQCPKTSGTIPGTAHSSFPVTFTLLATSDVEIFMHITYSGTVTSGDTSTFTGKLTGTTISPITKTETVTAS